MTTEALKINVTGHGTDLILLSEGINAWNRFHPHPYWTLMSSAKDGQEYLVITWKPLVRRIIPQSELEARRAPDAKHFHPKSEISEADMLTICEDWEMELVDETAGWWGLESKKRTTGACLR